MSRIRIVFSRPAASAKTADVSEVSRRVVSRRSRSDSYRFRSSAILASVAMRTAGRSEAPASSAFRRRRRSFSRSALMAPTSFRSFSFRSTKRDRRSCRRTDSRRRPFSSPAATASSPRRISFRNPWKFPYSCRSRRRASFGVSRFVMSARGIHRKSSAVQVPVADLDPDPALGRLRLRRHLLRRQDLAEDRPAVGRLDPDERPAARRSRAPSRRRGRGGRRS